MSWLTKLPRERLREILGAVMFGFTVFIFLAFVSDGYQGRIDQRSLEGIADVPNLCGKPGAILAGFLYLFIGYSSHVLYFLTCVWTVMLFRQMPLDRLPVRFLGMVVLSGAVAGFLHLDFSSAGTETWPGGVFGSFAATRLVEYFGFWGSNIILLMLGAIGLLLSTEFFVLHLAAGLYAATSLIVRGGVVVYGAIMRFRGRARQERRQLMPAGRSILGLRFLKRKGIETGSITTQAPDAKSAPVKPIEADDDGAEDDLSRINVRGKPLIEPVQETLLFDPADAPLFGAPVNGGRKPNGAAKPKPVPRRKVQELDELPPDYVYPRHYRKPSIDMLDLAPPALGGEDLPEKLRQTSIMLEKALQTHGIEARVTDVTRGPTITRFELEPAPGIKVSKFLALADDLALALKALGVRVEAPIPGKGRIGIEIPNDDREAVVLRELLESREVRKSKGRLVLALGKDIEGDVMVADLTAMPHLLVAGATGSGKTVCIKTILASLLFTKTPEELQLVLVDPKMVELSILNDIPHLITPVVTDPKKAATALNWLISEMEERYRLFAQLRVRNIEVYNESVENGEIEMPEEEGVESSSMDLIRKLPYIVCVIDELADLMMLARNEVEDAIMRLAQLARAVGIHLIIATQRPSVNVLTGVIKANFPVRIAFQVSSKVDSRCILDEMGAERLIGKGDMLYLPPGTAAPTRIQGAFVSDREMNALISYLKSQAPPQYRDEIENFGRGGEAIEDFASETDELLDDAVRVVLETGQASISMVQRRLRVGYTRAARLIDIMELKGIVGPHLGSKAREILVDCAPAD
jgi:S-DNA-T family DNA segregation ATPase FtsK/SpoIIIE